MEIKKLTVDMLYDLVRKAQGLEADLRKFDNGNASAGIRARWGLQNVRMRAKNIRKEIQRVKKLRRVERQERLKELFDD